MPGNKVNDQVIYKPDKAYGLEQKLERFELPYSATFDAKFPAMVELAAKNTARIAAEKYARIGHHWRNDLGVEVDKSELQISLDDFGSTSTAITDFEAQNQGSVLNNKYDSVAFVVKMWYVVPKINVEVLDNSELAEPDGFVENMPTDGKIEEDL